MVIIRRASSCSKSMYASALEMQVGSKNEEVLAY